MLLNCLTPLALLSLGSPTLPTADLRLVEAPAGIGVRPAVPGPPDTKGWYGTPYTNSLTTPNFGLSWQDGDATEEQAGRAAAALEAAWTELVEREGWKPPVSSDTYLLWILLVDDIGATGYTTEYTTPEYPDGYPVIYLNTTMAGDEGFWTTLASHEFHHAIQYAMRDYGSGGAEESWYWEASATWAANLVEPDTASLDYISAWYATASADPYTSTEGSHQYGMFVFNAWLDTGGSLGEGTMQRVWEAGAAAPGASWRTTLEASTGMSADALWGAFAAAYGNDTYWRADTWFDPDKPRLLPGRTLEGEAGELGSAYYFAPNAVEVEVVSADDFAVSAPNLTALDGNRWTVPAGTTLAITGLDTQGAVWSITADNPGEPDTGEGEDTALPDDTGTPDDTAGDTGRGRRHDPPEEDAACGCATPGPSGPAFALATALLLIASRRRRIVDLRA